MKKYGILALIICSALLFGCEKKPKLVLKQDLFIYELGEPIPKELDAYLDVEKLDEKQINEAALTLSIPKDRSVTKGDKTYVMTGSYEGTITYLKEAVHFTVEIKDTTAPQLSGLSSIEIPLGTPLDYSLYFNTQDLNELEPITFDESQIDYQTEGTYMLKVISKDVAQNETVLEVPVTCILVNENQEASSEIISNEDGSQHYVTHVTDKKRSILMDVPYYNQFALGAPVGCESVSLYMALRYKGYVSDLDCVSFISTTPQSPDNNPHHGFVGTVFDQHRYDILPAIFPSAFTPWANQYGKALDISGTGTEGVINQLLAGNPVVIWATAYFKPIEWQQFDWGSGFRNTHTVCLTGVDEDLGVIYYNDPVTKKNETVDIATFSTIYEVQNFGVAIL